MGFYIVKGDLFEQKVDGIVVPTAPHLRLEGTIGTQVKEKCGNKLVEELKQLKNINISEAVITNSYNLKCKKIIHVANPMWIDGKHNEEFDLKSSYLSALEKAQDFGLDSVAFPLLSSGANKFKPRKALEIAINTITEFVEDNQMKVCLVIDHDSYFKTCSDLFKKHKIVEGHTRPETKRYIDMMREEARHMGSWYDDDIGNIIENGPEVKKFCEKLKYFMSLKGYTAAKTYNGVISKAMYNKILNGSIPKKYTAVALGVNLMLDEYEINELLSTIGERLLNSIERDVIIIRGLRMYHDYNDRVDNINNDLVSMDYPPLIITKNNSN